MNTWLAPRQTRLFGGERGPGNRTPSRTGAVYPTWARIFPITAGKSRES